MPGSIDKKKTKYVQSFFKSKFPLGSPKTPKSGEKPPELRTLGENNIRRIPLDHLF